MPPKRKSVSGVQEAVKKLKPTAKRPRALATHSNDKDKNDQGNTKMVKNAVQ
jgi:hypothetical protein